MLLKQGITVSFVRGSDDRLQDVSFVDHRTRCCFSTERDSHFFDIRDLRQADRLVWGPNRADAMLHRRQRQQQAHATVSHEPSCRSAVHETLTETAVSMLGSLFSEGSRRHEDEELMHQKERGGPSL